MKRLPLFVPVLFGGAKPYYKKVLAIEPANLIGFWRLNETAGATAFDLSGQGNNGEYNGVALANAAGPDGVLVPWWDGANDCNNIGSAGFNTDFNGQEVTLAAWAKVNAAAVWSDGAFRKIIHIGVDLATNAAQIDKSGGANTLRCIYIANSVAKQIDITFSGTGWFHVAITASLSGDAMKAYINGVQSGATLTELGTWAGALEATRCNIGARQAAPDQVWHGWLGPVAVWNKVLTPAQMLNLAAV